MISFSCPKCERAYSVKEDLAGKPAKCACGARFKLPLPGSDPTPATAPPPGHDVFISYSSVDRPVAFALCGALEGEGIRCWIAPKSILPGMDYGEAIIGAINACRVLVLVFSQNSNESKQVKFEIERAASKGKRLIPFRIDSIPLSPSLEYFLSSSHWLDAAVPPVEKYFSELARAVRGLLQQSDPAPGHAAQKSPAPAPPPSGSLAEWEKGLAGGGLTVDLCAEDDARLDMLAAVTSRDMLRRGFTESDGEKTSVVLKELVNNVTAHAGDAEKQVRVTVSYEPSRMANDGVVCLRIQDRGEGFDLREALEKLWEKLDAGDREHGLLRALRYGTELKQERQPGAHAIIWKRFRRPETLPSLFDGASHVVPVVWCYGAERVRIVNDIYLFRETQTWSRRGFLEMIFEPIRRSGARYIGLEVRGRHPTLGAGLWIGELLDRLWAFRATVRPPKKMILFANTEREDHNHFRRFYEQVAAEGGDSLAFFEDPDACNRFLSEQKPP